MKVIIISPEPWGQNFVSKHHYALSFVKHGHEVFFINPPTNNLEKEKIETKTSQEGVLIVDYKAIRGTNKFPKLIKNWLQKKDIDQLLKITGTPDLVISFDPFRFQNLNIFNSRKTVYFPADWHNNKLEEEISKSANYVISVSELIANQYKKWNANCKSIGHGVASEFFDNSNKVSIKLNSSNNLKIGYVGNLNYSLLDFPALRKILTTNSQYDFFFIGPNGKSNLSEDQNPFWSEVRKLNNVHLLGPKKFKEVKSYLDAFDVLLLCYKGFENKIFLSNNHKMLEYLSSGKPIISHYVDEYKNNQELLYMITDENEDFDQFFKRITHNLNNLEPSSKIANRIDFAKKNLYLNKAVQLLELINLYE